MSTSSSMQIFQGLPFPYSQEIRELQGSCVPNLQISNKSQSFYSLLKFIRNDLIKSKLKTTNALALDKYINEILGVKMDVSHYYPPENISKLEKFFEELENVHHISQIQLNSIVYYLLKDFDSKFAEKWVQSHHDTTLLIPRAIYDLINGIYFIDRFDIYKAVESFKAIDSVCKSVIKSTSLSFVNHLIRIANIIPYHEDIDPNTLGSVDFYTLYKTIELSSIKNSSRSVISLIQSLDVSLSQMNSEILVIYFDSLSDFDQGLALIDELQGNSFDKESIKISLSLLLKIVVMKILYKSDKQRQCLKKIRSKHVISETNLNQIFKNFSIWTLLNPSSQSIDIKINKILHDLIHGKISTEEGKLKVKFPHFFNKLENSEIRQIASAIVEYKNELS